MATAAYDKRWVCHGSRDDAEYASARGRRPLAVHDDLATAVIFEPGEVVMVLYAGNDVRAEPISDVTMNNGVICRGMKPHCRPSAGIRKALVRLSLVKSGRHKTRTCDLYGVNVAL